MKMTRGVCGLLVVGLVSLSGRAWAQEAKKAEESKKAAPAGPPLPKPGPEHEVLKNDVGTWDATVEMIGPGGPPATSKGVETNTMLGGLWLVTDFKSEMMNQPFQGHGIEGYDPLKKKYVGTWVDSMTSGLSLTESSYDAAKKTMTGWIEGPDPSGKITKMRAVTEWKDPDTRVFTIYGTGPDGKEAPGLRITYKRRK